MLAVVGEVDIGECICVSIDIAGFLYVEFHYKTNKGSIQFLTREETEETLTTLYPQN